VLCLPVFLLILLLLGANRKTENDDETHPHSEKHGHKQGDVTPSGQRELALNEGADCVG